MLSNINAAVQELIQQAHGLDCGFPGCIVPKQWQMGCHALWDMYSYYMLEYRLLGAVVSGAENKAALGHWWWYIWSNKSRCKLGTPIDVMIHIDMNVETSKNSRCSSSPIQIHFETIRLYKILSDKWLSFKVYSIFWEFWKCIS